MKRFTHAAAIALVGVTALMSAIAFPVSSAAAHPLVKIWTSKRGEKLLAQLEEVSEGTVYLRKADGALVSIPLNALSVTDRALLERLRPAAKGKRASPAIPGPPDSPRRPDSGRPLPELPNGFRFDGSAIYRDCAPVAHWSETSNVVWKTELPWWGHGQGCIAKGRIFILCEPRGSIAGVQLICLSAHTGDIIWRRDVNMFGLFPEDEVSADRAAWLEDRRLEHRIYKNARTLAALRPYLLAEQNPTNAVTQYRDRAQKLHETGAKKRLVEGGPKARAWMYDALAAKLETIADTIESDSEKTRSKRKRAFQQWKREADILGIPYGFTLERTEGVVTDVSKPHALTLNLSHMTPTFQRSDAQQKFRARMSRNYALYYNDWAHSGAFSGRTGFGSIGTAFPSPVTDGKLVYVWTGNNVAACYDTDRHCKWLRWFGPLPRRCGRSFVSSPILTDGKLILFDCAARMGVAMRALDAATGRTLWERDSILKLLPERPDIGEHHGTPAIVMLAGTKAVFAPDATVTRLADGHLLGYVGKETGAWMSGWCSPVTSTPPPDDGSAVVYFINGGSGGGGSPVPPDRPSAGSVLAVKLTLEGDTVKGERLWVCKTDISRGSPLTFHKGLLYAGTSVIDPANGGVLRKLPVWDYVRIKRERVRRSYAEGSAHLLPIAGRRLYHLNTEGICMVFETGRTNALVAVNALGMPEHVFDNRGRPGHQFCYGASPWFSGNRIFIRSPFHLYSIGDPTRPTVLTPGQDILPPPAGPAPVPVSLEHASVAELVKFIETGRSGNVMVATHEIRRRLADTADRAALLSQLAPVIPALVAALTLNHMEQRRDVAKTLAAMGPAAAPAVPVLQGLLSDDAPIARIQAMEALAIIAPAIPSQAVPVLMEGLSDTTEPISIRAPEAQAFRPPSVRDWAAIGLAATGKHATNAIPALLTVIGQLEDWEWYWNKGTGTRLYRRLVSALAATGAANVLCDHLETRPADNECAAALMALGMIRPVSRRSVTFALRTRGRNAWKIRDRVFAAMGPGAAAGLANALKSRDYGVPKAAADYLVKIGEPALPELAVHADDKAIAARVKSVVAKIKVAARGADGIPSLVKYLKDPRPETRRWASDLIRSYGVEALPRLRTLMNDDSLRSEAIEIIAGIADAGQMAVPGLLDLIRASTGTAKLTIVDALTQKGEPMRRLLEPYVREPTVGPVASEVVQRIRLTNNPGPEAIPALIQYLKHPSKEAQRWASSQLRIRGKAAIPELAKHQEDPLIGKTVKDIMRAIAPNSIAN